MRRQRCLLALVALVLAPLGQAQIQRNFVNLGFEVPNLGTNPCLVLTRASDIPGWNTTETETAADSTGCNAFTPSNGTPGDGVIEVWARGFNGVPSAEGNQHAELNAYTASRLSQSVCLISGDPISFTMAHRGRNSATVPDVAEFNIDSAANTVVQASTTSNSSGGVVACGGLALGSPSDGPVAGTTDGSVAAPTCSSATLVQGWRRYTGTFTWSGSTATHNIGFVAVSSASTPDIGNFLDAVDVTLRPVVEFSTTAQTLGEGAATTAVSLTVVGTVLGGGMVVPITVSGTASAGSDFTTTGAVTIPAGNYQTPTQVPLGAALSLIDDSLIENNETVLLTLQPNPSLYVLGDTATCGGAAEDTATFTLVDNDVDLLATKTSTTSTPASGVPFQYTVTFSNNTAAPTLAPLTAHDATAAVADAVPSGLSFGSWTCTASNGARCPGGSVNGTTSGSGAISGSAVLPAGNAAAGGRVSYVINAQSAPTACSGSIVNTAGITTPAALSEGSAVQAGFVSPAAGGTSNNSASTTGTPSCQATLAVSKSDASPSYTPGGTATYTITVTNSGGPSVASNVGVTDTLPAGVTLAGTPSCAVTGTASCGVLSGAVGGGTAGMSGASIAPGAGNALILQLPVAFGAAMTTNPLINTVTATASGSPSASASDSDTLALRPNLAIGMTDNQSIYTPGTSGTYLIDITNTGPSSAGDVSVSDALPAGVTLAGTPTCSVLGSGSCGTITGAAGASSFGVSAASVAAGGGNRLRYSLPVAFGAGMTTNPLVNTATATATGQAAPVSASDSDTVRALTGLTVGKTDNSNTYTPGGSATYLVSVTNAGPSNALNVSVGDSLPAGVTLSGTPTCSVSGTATCGSLTGAAGAASFSVAGASIAAGAGNSISYRLPVNFAAGLTTDPLVNTATATDPADPTPDSASDSDARLLQSSLAISKTDGSARYTPGTGATYTLIVTNAGPSPASNTTIADTLPAGVTLSAAPTCVATGTAACGTLSGTAGGSSFGATGASIAAGSGNSLTFALPVAFASGLSADPLVNSATASDPSDATPASASDSDTLDALVGLTVIKDDASPTYTPGGGATYNIVVTNAGPSDAMAVAVTDTLPAGVTLSAPASCASVGVATCGTLSGTSGAGSISLTGATLQAGAGNQLVLSVPVRFAADLTANPLVNSVTATDPSDPTPAQGSDSNARASNVVLDVSKTDGSLTYTPGGNATYIVLVSNTGSTDADDVTLDDDLPAGVTLAAGTTCTPRGSASCGTLTATAGSSSVTLSGARIAAGAGNQLSLSIPVGFAATMSTDPLVNRVTVTSPEDPTGASASDSDSLAAVSGLTVTKTDSVATYTPGGSAIYTVVVTNAGPSPAAAVSVLDNLPGGVSLSAAPTCAAAGTASCGSVTGAAGGTSFGSTGASIGAGAGNSLTFSIPVLFAADLGTDPLANSVTASDPSDPTPHTATDSDARAADVALTLSKTDASAIYVPGGSATYTLVIGNSGLSDAGAVALGDTLPAGVTLTAAPSCLAAGSARCGTLLGSSGDSSVSLSGASIPAGAGNSLTLSLPVAFAPGLTTDPLVNTATASDPDDPDGASASDSNTRAADVALALSKTDGSTTYVPGDSATYTLVIGNSGLSDAVTVGLSDTLPAGVTLTAAPSCVAAGSARCGTLAGGSGDSSVSLSGAAIPTGAAHSLTLSLPVAFAAGLTTDPLVNTATASDSGDPDGASASDSDGISAQSNLSVSKSGPATARAGDPISWAVTVRNHGPTDSSGYTLVDTLPAGIANVSTSAPGCNLAGSTLTCIGAALASGASFTYTINATVSTPFTQALVNSASVQANEADPLPEDNTATHTIAPQASRPAVPVPAASLWSMVLLAGGLLLLWRRVRT